MIYEELSAGAKVEQADGGNPALVAAYEAALAVASEVEIGAVLQRIVDLARQVVPARYAALGVADDAGRLEQFLISGIAPEEQARIGPLPEGHGLLGVLIKEGKPLLVPDIAADPRSVGFPPNHPEMRTLLGVPILLGNRTLGNLYLTERHDGGPFTPADLADVQVLAAHAAAAIDRARLYDQVEAGRRRAEVQRDQLRVILDNLPSGVLIQTIPDGETELANEAAIELLLGAAAPRGTLPAYGRDYWYLQADGTRLPPEGRPGILALRGNVIRNRQETLWRSDGSHLPILIQAAPLRDTAGQITRAVVVFQDVTRLREAEQLKDDFLSLVSHEFRTPLTAIHGGAHLLAHQSGELEAETRRELLEDIVTESGRLDRMLANMLSLADTMAGRTELRTEPVLLPPLIRRAAAEIGARSPAFVFSFDLAPNLPPVEGDQDRLAQILRNLYENAVKYSPGGGEIRTSATSEGAVITIEVADSGVGIAPEHVPLVFERFRRPGADPTVRGMGLGLYLSRLLVEAQGGRISARSAGVGEGATFAIILPIAHGWNDDGDHQYPEMEEPCASD